MGTKLLTVVCVLVSAGLVTGRYYIPTVIMDTSTNSVCPPDSHMDAVRSQIADKISNVLANSCGDSRSGWKQVAFLNMTDPDETCPDAWRLYQDGSVRACGRPVGAASCNSVYFSPGGYAYTKVCGRVSMPVQTQETISHTIQLQGMKSTNPTLMESVWNSS